MKKNFEEAKRWYQQNGVSNEPWDEYDSHTKELIALEATFDEWPEVSHMREVGMGPEAVSVYFEVDKLDCTDTAEYERRLQDRELSLSVYLAQNASGNLRRLLTESWSNVETVTDKGDKLEIIVAP